MSRWFRYNVTTGEVLGLFMGQEANLVELEAEEAWTTADDSNDPRLSTVDTGTGDVLDKTSLSSVASWDVTTIDSDGVDTATLSSLPIGAVIEIEKLDTASVDATRHDIADTSVVITVDDDGLYQVTAKHTLHLDYVEIISAGQVIGVTACTIDTEMFDVTIINAIQIDAASVTVTALDPTIDFTP